jgi:hypothetical protein
MGRASPDRAAPARTDDGLQVINLPGALVPNLARE